jgi:hypothetical protein
MPTTAQTGVILRYTSPNFGIIRTNIHGNGILSADVVFLCSEHNLVSAKTNGANPTIKSYKWGRIWAWCLIHNKKNCTL